MPSKVIEHVEVRPGDTREFHELTMGGFAQLQKYINKRPRPQFSVIDLSGPLQEAGEALARSMAEAGLSEDAKLKALAETRRAFVGLAADQMREARWEAAQWPPDMGSTEAARVLLTGDGGKAYFLWVMLRQQRPETRLEEAEAIFEDMDPVTFGKILGVAFGQADAAGEGEADPKGPGDSPSGESASTS